MSKKLPGMYTSHRDDTHGGGEAPTQAHLALQTAALDGDPNALLAIPAGSTLFIIEDPRRADTILQVVLEKVEFDNHVFKGLRCRAFSKSDKSSRRLYLTASWTGQHVSKLDEENKGVEANMAVGDGSKKVH